MMDVDGDGKDGVDMEVKIASSFDFLPLVMQIVQNVDPEGNSEEALKQVGPSFPNV
jgi:hypothetical protein